MRTNVVDWLIGTRTTSKLVAAILWISAIAVGVPAQASNPWGRAVGEAQGLHDVTEDLRNRAHRLCPGSVATTLACVTDEAACRLLEMVKGSADWGQLQLELQGFQQLQTQLCRAVADDCHLSRDRGIQNYLRMVDDRFGDLVRDLSKCKPPASNCHTDHSHYYQPSAPTPYSSNYYGAILRIPQPVQPQPVFPNDLDPRYANPGVNPNAPQYWQGSLPRSSYYPQSTYDNEPATAGYYRGSQVNAGSSIAAEHPMAAEILSLLLSRVQR